jgi:dTDP-4-dehydrorhamnose 3,5-epimerase
MGVLKDSKPYLTELKIIEQPQGCVMHGIKASDPGFSGFGEAYFSTVNKGCIKGWKLHREMTLNLVVPSGEIRFVVHDGIRDERKPFIEPLIDVVLGDNNYRRLTIPPKFWLAFEGVGININMLMNIANIEHDPIEALNQDLDYFNVKGCEDFG